MIANRRQFLAMLGLSAFAGAATAESARIDVVKVLSFHCAFSRESEALDGAYSRLLAEHGGRLVPAPVPDVELDRDMAKELVYYAARDIRQDLGDAIKAALYEGVHDRGLQLAGFLEVNTWLQESLPERFKNSLGRVFTDAQGPSAKQAVRRAVKLAVNSGVDALPSYLLIKGGRVIATFDRGMPGLAAPSALREAVFSKITQISN